MQQHIRTEGQKRNSSKFNRTKMFKSTITKLILLSTCMILLASQSDQTEEVCSLTREVGLCRAIIPSWYFEKSSGTCQEFDYSGCGGNANNFKSLKQCQAKCGAVTNVCMLKKAPGLCRSLLPAWYYDAESGQCKKFNYGGCGGNANNFNSKKKCDSICPKKV